MQCFREILISSIINVKGEDKWKNYIHTYLINTFVICNVDERFNFSFIIEFYIHDDENIYPQNMSLSLK